ncbi:MAG: GDYXXLXY domain-containing protein [Verrucomicrobia bacterium]|nr:GDYXXLXY domain-containing protein [Verrucomicrobiota bacterium]
MKPKLLALVLALQCVWLLATTFTQERALRVGQLIMLETRPVDPRDLLRGDYVTLGYPISDVPLKLFSPACPNVPDVGTTIYVALAPAANGFYEVARAATASFTPDGAQVLVQGKSRYWWGATNSVRVEYGLERYYVREGTGNPRGKLTVQAAVPKSGRATIKEVFVDGKPYAEAMKAAGK